MYVNVFLYFFFVLCIQSYFAFAALLLHHTTDGPELVQRVMSSYQVIKVPYRQVIIEPPKENARTKGRTTRTGRLLTKAELSEREAKRRELAERTAARQAREQENRLSKRKERERGKDTGEGEGAGAGNLERVDDGAEAEVRDDSRAKEKEDWRDQTFIYPFLRGG
jgi:hypothetical protein